MIYAYSPPTENKHPKQNKFERQKDDNLFNVLFFSLSFLSQLGVLFLYKKGFSIEIHICNG